MPVKKVQKKPAKKVSKKMKEGDLYRCSVCGLSVVVDEVCGCADYCDIICCEKPMKSKSARA